MAKMVKCPICEEQFDRDVVEFIKVGRRYYHPKCHEKFEFELEQKQKEQEKKQESKPVEKKVDKQDIKISEEQYRRELIGYIINLYKLPTINGLILKQIREFRELGYTYQGMKSTLYYFHEIKENPVIATGVGIIPFVYDEAKEWYTQKALAHKHFNELDEENKNEIVKKRVVKVQSKPLEVQRRVKIDIEEI